MNTSGHVNGEIENSRDDSVPNHSESQIINEVVSMEVENGTFTVPSTDCLSNGTDNSQDVNSANCRNENTNSPNKSARSHNRKDSLKSPLFKSPIKQWDKSARFTDMAQTSVCPQRKRTISSNSDYDKFQSDLNDTENVPCLEGIDLLHDLDSVIKFEDSKDIFFSTIMDVTREDDLGVNKDPVTDPLSISDCEKKDTDTLAESHSIMLGKKREIRTALRSQMKRQMPKCYFKNKKRKTNTEKKLLKELKIFEEEWEEMSLSNIKKLSELCIKLIHKVPPQHKIERTGSNAPTNREKMLFQKHGPIRKGSYTPVEDKIIRKNWKKFCKLHDWNVAITKPFLCWRHNDRYYINKVEERQKFVQFLANGLPWRTLHSVHSRFKVLYRNKITRTRYTSKEDKKILRYMRNKLDKRDTKYSELAKLLRRTRRSVWKRYQYLKNRIQNKSETELDVRWTLPLIRKFIKALLSVTLSEDIRELKDAALPKPVWQKMEEKLNIHEKVLRTFWQHQLHLQLFSVDPIYLNDIKIQLIE